MVKWNKSGKALSILGNKIEINEVSEPTDIDWTAQSNSNFKLFVRTNLMRLLMTLFLLALLYLSSIIGNKAFLAEERYPSNTDCHPVEEQFSTVDLFREFAEDDKELTLESIGNGDY